MPQVEVGVAVFPFGMDEVAEVAAILPAEVGRGRSEIGSI
jgi:hypothetical protein